MTDTWNVLAHGPIEPLAENLWRVEGSLRRMSLKRVMTAARRTDGGLVVHSAVAMNEPEMAALDALGPIAYLLVPNGLHRLDAPAYKRRYPALKVYAPRGSVKKVAQVVPVEGTYDEFPADDVVSLATLAGTGEREGAMSVRSQDGVTLVLNDVVMNMDTKTDVLGWMFTTVFGSAPGPRVSRLVKLALVDDRAALRAELLRYADIRDLVRLVVSHEKVSHGAGAAATLRQAATFL